MWGLGRIGKDKTFENVRKRLKTCVKRSKIFEKLGEIFKNIRKYSTFLRLPCANERAEGVSRERAIVCTLRPVRPIKSLFNINIYHFRDIPFI